MLFGRNDYDYSLIQTSSKEALKRSALLVCNNDIRKASELYEFFVKDMPNIPDVDPMIPSAFDQMRDAAVGIFNWGRENQDQIVGFVNIVLNAMGKSPIGVPTPPVTDVPPPPIS